MLDSLFSVYDDVSGECRDVLVLSVLLLRLQINHHGDDDVFYGVSCIFCIVSCGAYSIFSMDSKRRSESNDSRGDSDDIYGDDGGDGGVRDSRWLS